MAAGYSELNLECQHSDTYPLLVDHDSSPPQPNHREHVLTIMLEDSQGLGNAESVIRPSTLQNETVIPVDGPSIMPASAGSQPEPNFASAGSFRSLRSPVWHGVETNYGAHQRSSPLNSGLWISIELTITVSQIIASFIVLSLSRDEKPKAPLSVWVVVYAAGCLATLPLLYWRYTHHYAHWSEQDSHHASSAVSSSNILSLPRILHAWPHGTATQGEEADTIVSTARGNQASTSGDLSMAVYVKRFKIALDCFFAVWFVVGNVWIFGGHSSSHEAPNLYRLCIVFLTFSCIGYAMPFIICATICCCLPCLITLLGFREDQGRVKGATSEVIEALPIYKFKTKNASKGKGCKDADDSDVESLEEGGIVAAGTDKERPLSAEDAVCCICLGKYKDDVELRGLPCAHFFHVDCVDKWLKINASCPLCKLEINSSSDEPEQQATSAGE